MNLRNTLELLWCSPTIRAMAGNTLSRFIGPRRTGWDLVIVESPFAGADPRYLRDCLRDCIARGESPYASHGLLPGALDDADPEQRRRGIDAGFAWRLYADRTVVYTDLGISRGMQAGIEHAQSMDHPIEYRSLSEWTR